MYGGFAAARLLLKGLHPVGRPFRVVSAVPVVLWLRMYAVMALMPYMPLNIRGDIAGSAWKGLSARAMRRWVCAVAVFPAPVWMLSLSRHLQWRQFGHDRHARHTVSAKMFCRSMAAKFCCRHGVQNSLRIPGVCLRYVADIVIPIAGEARSLLAGLFSCAFLQAPFPSG